MARVDVNMPEGCAHKPLEASELVDIEISVHRERIRFAMCELNFYDVILRKKWREVKNAAINNKQNEISS